MRIHQRAHFRREIIAVAHEHRDRRTERLAAANAGEKLDLVVLDLHARAAPVPPCRRASVSLIASDVQAQMRRNAVEDADERGPVRFARGKVPKHSRPASAHRSAPTSVRAFQALEGGAVQSRHVTPRVA